LRDFVMRPVNSDAVLLTYLSEVVYDGEVEISNRSSLWIKSADMWRLRFHPGTPTAAQVVAQICPRITVASYYGAVETNPVHRSWTPTSPRQILRKASWQLPLLSAVIAAIALIQDGHLNRLVWIVPLSLTAFVVVVDFAILAAVRQRNR
jgi:hypothetical protein